LDTESVPELAEINKALKPGGQKILEMQAAAETMAKARVMDELPLKASSRVEGSSTKQPTSGQATTITHFLGWGDRTTLDRLFEFCLRIRGLETKRALDAKNKARWHKDSSDFHFF
jgi:hypothetical protein